VVARHRRHDSTGEKTTLTIDGNCSVISIAYERIIDTSLRISTTSSWSYRVYKASDSSSDQLVVKQNSLPKYEAAAKISRLSAAPKIIRAGNCRRWFVSP
jgi:hypothetical protein